MLRMFTNLPTNLFIKKILTLKKSGRERCKPFFRQAKTLFSQYFPKIPTQEYIIGLKRITEAPWSTSREEGGGATYHQLGKSRILFITFRSSLTKKKTLNKKHFICEQISASVIDNQQFPPQALGLYFEKSRDLPV